MLYSLYDLEQTFGKALVDSARRLLRHQEVARLNVARGGAVITGIVPEAEESRRVYVRIEGAPGKPPMIRSECSCRARGGCAHAVAVLLGALEPSESSPKAPSPARARIADGGRCLRYLLRPQAGGRLELRLLVVRRRPDGSLGDGSRFYPAAVGSAPPPAFLDQQDLAILPQLPSGASHRTELHVRDGNCLRAMLATERCHLEQPDGALLQAGEDLSMGLTWMLDHRGRQHANWEGLLAQVAPLALDEPWYLDPERARCGRLATPIPPALAVELIEAPLEPERIEVWREQLAAAGCSDHLLLQLLLVEHRILAPVPELTLETRAPEDPDGEPADLASLRFIYGTCRLGRQGEPVWLEEGKVVRAARDRAAETACLAELQAAGMTCDEGWSARLGCDCLRPAERGAESWFLFQQRWLPEY